MNILCVKGAWKFQPPPSPDFVAPSQFFFPSPLPPATSFLCIMIEALNSALLVFQEEYYHTRLAGCYLDTVMKLREDRLPNSQHLQQARKKLKEFLESSVHYRAPELLSRVQDTDLHMECAILFGRVRRENYHLLGLHCHEAVDARVQPPPVLI